MQLKQFLTTNRTDSLQYTALIAAYKAYSPYGARTRYLSLSVPHVIQCATAPPICQLQHVCCGRLSIQRNRTHAIKSNSRCSILYAVSARVQQYASVHDMHVYNIE